MSELLNAIEKSDLEQIQKLLKSENLDLPDIEDVIFKAVYSDDENIAHVLFGDPRIDPSLEDNRALKLAIKRGKLQLVNLLLNDDRVLANASPLLNAVANNDMEKLNRVLGEDKKYSDCKEIIALAVLLDKPKLVKMLLEDGKYEPREHGNAALRFALDSRNPKILKYLVEDKRIQVNPENSIILWDIAINYNYSDFVPILLEKDTTLNSEILHEKLVQAVEAQSSKVVQFLLKDSRLNLEDYYYEAFDDAINVGNTKVVEVFVENSSVQEALSLHHLLLAVELGHLDIVKLLVDRGIDPSDRENKACKIAASMGHIDIATFLLSHPSVDPSEDKNILIRLAAKNGHAKIVELLLQDERVDPTAKHNEALIQAAKLGYVDVVKVLMQDKRIDPSAENNKALKVATKKGHSSVVEELIKDKRIVLGTKYLDYVADLQNDAILELILPRVKYFGLPYSEILDSNATKPLYEQITELFDNPSAFLENSAKISLSQLEAYKILALKHEVQLMEEEQKQKMAQHPESAMQDPQVIQANEFFEKNIKPAFEKKILSFAQDSSKEAAIANIEKEIRSMLLNEMLKNSNNDDLKKFIKDNRDALVTGNDKHLMNLARKNFFSSATNALEVAWRGYDKFATVRGYDNLLVEPESEHEIFSTRAASAGSITNRKASDLMRERVAYYFLLVTDKDIEGSSEEIAQSLENRKTNFINELADLMRAHSHDYLDNPDAPSCFPGYIGRIANLGFEHPLSKQSIGVKLMVADIIRPVILAKFKEALQQLNSEEEYETLLKAVSTLTEKANLAQNIFVKNDKFEKDYLPIRYNFINTLGSEEELCNLVNEELIKRGRTELLQTDEVNETLYVKQYRIDPSRLYMMGPIGKVYSDHVKHLIKEQPEISTPITPSQERTIKNPYTNQFTVLANSKEVRNNPAFFQNRLKRIKEQETIFEFWKNFVLTNTYPAAQQFRNSSSVNLILEILTEVTYDSEIQIKDDSQLLQTILHHEPYKSTLHETLQRFSYRDEFSEAFGKLTSLQHKDIPSRPTMS